MFFAETVPAAAESHGLSFAMLISSTEGLIITSNVLLVLVTGLLILVTVRQEHAHSEHEAKITAEVTTNVVNAFVKLAEEKGANVPAKDDDVAEEEGLGHA